MDNRNLLEEYKKNFRHLVEYTNAGGAFGINEDGEDDPNAMGGDPSMMGGDPNAMGGADPMMGGDPGMGGDPNALGPALVYFPMSWFFPSGG